MATPLSRFMAVTADRVYLMPWFYSTKRSVQQWMKDRGLRGRVLPARVVR